MANSSKVDRISGFMAFSWCSSRLSDSTRLALRTIRSCSLINLLAGAMKSARFTKRTSVGLQGSCLHIIRV